MALAALAIVFVGFAATYYLWPITRATHTLAGRPISPSFPLIVHLHATGFSVWILLLLVQVRLVAAGRTALHKRLGLVAAGLVPFLVVTGIMTAVHGAHGGWTPPGGPFADALGFMVVPLGDMVVFTGLVIPGLALRRRPGVHKRLMLFATIGALVPPATTRRVADRPPALCRSGARTRCQGFSVPCAIPLDQLARRPRHFGVDSRADTSRHERSVAHLCRLVGWIKRSRSRIARFRSTVLARRLAVEGQWHA